MGVGGAGDACAKLTDWSKILINSLKHHRNDLSKENTELVINNEIII